MVGGRGVRLHERSGVREAELFLCVDVDAGAAESLVRIASAVERDWLPVTEGEVMRFDAERRAVDGVRQLSYEDLVIEETIALPQDAAAASELLFASPTP